MTEAKMSDISSRAPKGKKHIAAMAITAVILLGAGGALFGKQLYAEYQHQKQIASVIDVDTFYHGIRVAGVDLGGKTMEQAKAAVQAAELNQRPKYNIELTYGGKSWNLTEKDLKFQFNVDSVLKEAYSYARSGDREERYQQVLALQKTPKDFQLDSMLDSSSLKTKLQEIAGKINCDPADPTIVSFNPATEQFRFADGKEGVSVDLDQLYSDVLKIAESSGSGTVQVPVKKVPFKKTIADIKSHMQKLGTYSTVSTNNAAGTHNMKLALSKINGTCIPAHGTFSFHGVVGNSNKANGFLEAGAILNGRLVKAYGGGICQASTTVYGAAIRSNMKITQRSNHTIQSTYCPIGQDAAVSYPELDFKFQNPTDYPIYIVTSSKGKVMTATFYGYHSPDYDRIEVVSQKTETIPAPTTPKYTVDKTLAKGQIRLDSKARDGARAIAKRVFYKNGVVVKTENLPSSYYKALPAFYSIGPGTSVDGIVSSAGSSSSSAKPSSKPQENSSKPSSAIPDGSSSKPGSQASAGSSSSQQDDAAGQPDPGNSDADETDVVIPD